MRKAYICSPLRADSPEGVLKNMEMAKEYMEIVSTHYDYQAVAIHAYLPEFLDDTIENERNLGMEFGLKYLELCQALFICGDKTTEGMKQEIAHANKLNIPIYVLNVRDEFVSRMRIHT